LQDWEGILDKEGNEVDAYLPSGPPHEKRMILIMTINSESDLQLAGWIPDAPLRLDGILLTILWITLVQALFW
jgi:hypothetical protein